MYALSFPSFFASFSNYSRSESMLNAFFARATASLKSILASICFSLNGPFRGNWTSAVVFLPLLLKTRFPTLPDSPVVTMLLVTNQQSTLGNFRNNELFVGISPTLLSLGNFKIVDLETGLKCIEIREFSVKHRPHG